MPIEHPAQQEMSARRMDAGICGRRWSKRIA
jgi:hypothetical protein